MQTQASRKTGTARPSGLWALPFTLVAVVATLISVAWIYKIIQRLPAFQAAKISFPSLDAAHRQAILQGSREVRDAPLLQAGASRLTTMNRPRWHAATSEVEIARVAGQISTTGAGRLLQISARLAGLAKAGEPVERWWPALAPYMQGLEKTSFAHHQAALEQALYEAFTRAGLAPGLAREFAAARVGETQGPFMQALVARLTPLIAERAQAGDVQAANACRAVLLRWLRQWLVEPGPTGLRMTAAQLLSSALAEPAVAGDDARAADIAAAARTWRDAYRTAAKAAPTTLFSVVSGPSAVASTEQALLRSIVSAGFAVGAAIVLTAVALLLLIPAIRGARSGDLCRTWCPLLICAGVFCGDFLTNKADGDGFDGLQRLVLKLAPNAAARHEPAHGHWHSYYGRYWMPPVWGAVAGGAGVLLAAAFALRSSAWRWGRMGWAVIPAAAGIGVVALLGCWFANRALTRLESERARQSEAGLVSALLGADAEKRLDPVRNWVP